MLYAAPKADKSIQNLVSIFLYIANDRSANIVSPVPILSVTLFAKAGQVIIFLFLKS